MSIRPLLLFTAVCSMAAAEKKPAPVAPTAPSAPPAAEAPATGSEPKLDSPQAKVSYVLGTNIGRNITRDKLQLDLDALVLGLKDTVEGRESKISAEEGQAVMTKFQEEMQAKQPKAGAESGDKNVKEGKDFLAKNAKREGVTTTKSGLQYEVMKTGTGPKPKPTDTVNVHYHGTLLDGKVFDSSVQRGEPATFGVTQVIPGWVEALQLMPVGSKWKLFIPSNLAYGETGAGGDIGPNATLIFEVELLGIEKK
ncbi:MAG: FKBP-type peptidyl-prolyl cis-trans isomerase [Verrucomicrobiales bacterium]